MTDADAAPEASTDESAAPRKRRGLRILWWVLGSIGALVVVAIVGMVIWSQVGVHQAEPGPLADARANPAIEFTDTSGAIVMTPTSGEPTVGLVFIPGAKVDPWAYADKLSGVVEGGVQVVITKPWLNLAFFDLRPLSAFTDLVPEVDTWAVGGHSLGGVRGCMLASDADALALFGSYCATDLSESGLAVISIAGENDLLSSAADIEAARPLLPADADMQVIDGANHAAFGDYGLQEGDGVATISDDEMIQTLTGLLVPFLTALGD